MIVKKYIKRLFCFNFAALVMSGFVTQADTLTEQEFNDKVRDYILSNPQVILDAMELLGEQEASRQMAERVAPHYEQLIVRDADLIIGSKNAPIKIIEFFDYRCAVCKSVVPTLEEFVMSNPDVVFIKKHLPILTPSSEKASRYGLATNQAYGAESYASVHKLLYQARKTLNETTFAEVAKQLGLSHEKIMAHYNSDAINQIIDENRETAIELEIRGTPAFLTSKTLKTGAVNLEDLNTIIDVLD